MHWQSVIILGEKVQSLHTRHEFKETLCFHFRFWQRYQGPRPHLNVFTGTPDNELSTFCSVKITLLTNQVDQTNTVQWDKSYYFKIVNPIVLHCAILKTTDQPSIAVDELQVEKCVGRKIHRKKLLWPHLQCFSVNFETHSRFIEKLSHKHECSKLLS